MKIPHYTTYLNPIFLWILLSLASYRLTHIVTDDSWYPFQWWRTFLAKHAQPAAKEGHHNLWTEAAELFSCTWCFGWWTSMVVFAVSSQMLSIPLPVLQFLAAAAVVGYLGAKED